MRIYLAGKMSGLSLEEMNEWRMRAEIRLQEAGFRILNPVDVEIDEKSSDREIVANNKAMIRGSDIILAEFDYEEPSFGTICEVIYANSLGIPVISWGRYPIRSPWVREHIVRHFDELEDAADYLIRSWNF